MEVALVAVSKGEVLEGAACREEAAWVLERMPLGPLCRQDEALMASEEDCMKQRSRLISPE